MVDAEKKLKMAIVSGAAHALRFKNENRYASDEEVIQQVTRETEHILSKLDSEE